MMCPRTPSLFGGPGRYVCVTSMLLRVGCLLSARARAVQKRDPSRCIHRPYSPARLGGAASYRLLRHGSIESPVKSKFFFASSRGDVAGLHGFAVRGIPPVVV